MYVCECGVLYSSELLDFRSVLALLCAADACYPSDDDDGAHARPNTRAIRDSRASELRARAALRRRNRPRVRVRISDKTSINAQCACAYADTNHARSAVDDDCASLVPVLVVNTRTRYMPDDKTRLVGWLVWYRRNDERWNDGRNDAPQPIGDSDR